MSDETLRSEVGRAIHENLDWMYGVAFALTGSKDAADNLVQDVIVRILPKRISLESSPRAYIRRTMVNLQIDTVRRTRRIIFESVESVEDIQESYDADVDLEIDVQAAMSQMPTEIRRVVVLRYLEDLSTNEVAKMLALPAGSVRRMAHEGIQILRKGFLGEPRASTKGRNK